MATGFSAQFWCPLEATLNDCCSLVEKHLFYGRMKLATQIE